jgi:nickel/cobalt transporter (NicO) family protein
MEPSRKPALLFSAFLCALCVLRGEYVFAHPVPKQNHDRTIEVKLKPNAVVVEYHLEVDEYRAVRDLPREDIERISSPEAIARVFLEYMAPILRENLFARLDGDKLTFTGAGKRDDTVKDHLRCDFTFTAAWTPAPGRPHTFAFRETNYDLEDFNRLHLTLTAEPGVSLQKVTAPEKALLERAPLDYKPGDSDRLRKVAATFVLTGDAEPKHEDKGEAQPEITAPKGEEEHPGKLLHLLLDTRRGLAVLLLLAAGFGAVHALTPGHGKTLVAAYLVGEHGTVWHAFVLGIMTTLTHTGAVFVLAFVFLISPGAANLIYYVQGLIGGLFIAGLGLWLLLRRLAGRADHFHLGGHSHHHHHDHEHAHDHTHADPSHGPLVPAGTSVRWWHLILLGMRGGLVPCWDAIFLLCLAISAQRLWLGVPLLLAFSAGLAGVLVALGVGVVWARNWVVARWGEEPRIRKVVRALPLVSAALITALGLWLCYDSLHLETPPVNLSERRTSAP